MMQFKNIFRLSLLLTVFISGNSYSGRAQDFSYIYIQGDKKTPIYTKVEGVMMPRYGKNYALLSRLAPGPLNLEILFQQNEYPPLTFTVLVPENGKRAFVLQHKGTEFSLYDVEQNFYLKPGNQESDDHLPAIINNSSIQIASNSTSRETQVLIPFEEVRAEEVRAEEPQPEPVPIPSPVPEKTSAAAQNTGIAGDSSTPKFIENITFNNDANLNEPERNGAGDAESGMKAEITNSDCSTAISTVNFQRLQNSINSRKTEDERLGILLDAVKQNCFSVEQARIVIEKLDSDIAKYSALKSFYPKIKNQSSFATLESLIISEDWKASFRRLVEAK